MVGARRRVVAVPAARALLRPRVRVLLGAPGVLAAAAERLPEAAVTPVGRPALPAPPLRDGRPTPAAPPRATRKRRSYQRLEYSFDQTKTKGVNESLMVSSETNRLTLNHPCELSFNLGHSCKSWCTPKTNFCLFVCFV